MDLWLIVVIAGLLAAAIVFFRTIVPHRPRSQQAVLPTDSDDAPASKENVKNQE